MPCASRIARQSSGILSAARPVHYHSGGRDFAGLLRSTLRRGERCICALCDVSVTQRTESRGWWRQRGVSACRAVMRLCSRQATDNRQQQSVRIQQDPATRRWQGPAVLNYLSCSGRSLGVSGLDGVTVDAATEGAAARASHVRQRRSAAVRAGDGLRGRRFPVCATRMRIGARGLVLRQCHGVFLYFVRTIELKRSELYRTVRTTSTGGRHSAPTDGGGVLYAAVKFHGPRIPPYRSACPAAWGGKRVATSPSAPARHARPFPVQAVP